MAVAITEWACALPGFGLLFGPIRIMLLFRLVPLPRVLAAMLGFVWWSGICYGAWVARGALPGLGAFQALAVGDILTVAKFSTLAIFEARARAGRF